MIYITNQYILNMNTITLFDTILINKAMVIVIAIALAQTED